MTPIHASLMRSGRARRGSVTLVVIWAVAIAAIVVAATQVLAWRQAVIGREALARVQARWAARGGIESMISIMEYYHQNPVDDDALALTRDLEANSVGSTETGEYDIRHFRDGVEYAGPMDEHSKFNVNLATKAQLMGLPFMTPDTADAIIDWRDDNDEVEAFGAEGDYYANRGYKYRPRNSAFRSIAELELVAGCRPDYVRGEDWNLNGRLDPNENDGSRSLPDDKPDGYLDAGWSAYLTASSKGSNLNSSGQPKIYLRSTTSAALQDRLGISPEQAAALLAFARSGNARLETLLVVPLDQLSGSQNNAGTSGARAGSSGRSSAGRSAANPTTPSVAPLDTKQLRTIFSECSLDDPFRRPIGRVNLNTVSSEVLQRALSLEPKVAEAIISRRNAKQGGLTSVVDLLEIGEVKPETLNLIAGQVGVESHVYLISSRGRAASTGTEVELIALVDRSTNPVTFIEVREP